jgi:hypothetical protein
MGTGEWTFSIDSRNVRAHQHSAGTGKGGCASDRVEYLAVDGKPAGCSRRVGLGAQTPRRRRQSCEPGDGTADRHHCASTDPDDSVEYPARRAPSVSTDGSLIVLRARAHGFPEAPTTSRTAAGGAGHDRQRGVSAAEPCRHASGSRSSMSCMNVECRWSVVVAGRDCFVPVRTCLAIEVSTGDQSYEHPPQASRTLAQVQRRGERR